MTPHRLFNSLVFLNVFCLIFATGSKMQLVITSIAQCKEKEDLPILVTNWQIIQQQKSKFYVSGSVNFTQEYPEGFDLHLLINRCPGDARLGNCDTFMSNFAAKNICFIMYKRPKLLQSYLDALEPHISCPIQAAFYTVSDLIIDESLIEYLPQLGATYWQIVIVGKLEEAEVACVEISASVHSRRSRG